MPGRMRLIAWAVLCLSLLLAGCPDGEDPYEESGDGTGPAGTQDPAMADRQMHPRDPADADGVPGQAHDLQDARDGEERTTGLG